MKRLHLIGKESMPILVDGENVSEIEGVWADMRLAYRINEQVVTATGEVIEPGSMLITFWGTSKYMVFGAGSAYCEIIEEIIAKKEADEKAN